MKRMIDLSWHNIGRRQYEQTGTVCIFGWAKNKIYGY